MDAHNKMKNIVLHILSGVIRERCNLSEQGFLESKDACFGLTLTGLTPQVFARGIVSDSTRAEHCQVAVSPDGKYLFFMRHTPGRDFFCVPQRFSKILKKQSKYE